MISEFIGFYKYLSESIFSGRWNLGIMISVTLFLFAILLYNDLLMLSLVELILGGGICIGYVDYKIG